jgi:putative ABC transport system substrate-binding protein
MRLIPIWLGLMIVVGPALADERVWRLGVLTPFDWPADTTMHTVMIPELARRGFVEGRNLVVLARWGGNLDSAQLTRLAQDLAAS